MRGCDWSLTCRRLSRWYFFLISSKTISFKHKADQNGELCHPSGGIEDTSEYPRDPCNVTLKFWGSWFLWALSCYIPLQWLIPRLPGRTNTQFQDGKKTRSSCTYNASGAVLAACMHYHIYCSQPPDAVSTTLPFYRQSNHDSESLVTSFQRD